MNKYLFYFDQPSTLNELPPLVLLFLHLLQSDNIVYGFLSNSEDGD